jgi:RNA polymerase sigma factor (sigma-70 family)
MSESGWPAIVAHRERLLRIARRRCPTMQDAEDVVHEAMVRCATFADLDDDRMGQFLTSVTVRLCADVYRHADRSQRAFGRLAGDDVEPGPEDAACQAADAAVLAELLATLPDRQRAVLVDRAHGMSIQQICSRRGLTYKAAESALARARGSMRSALATAFGAVVTAGAALRPRRAAIAALPAAGFVAVAATVSVLRLPLGAEAVPEVRLPALADGRGGAGQVFPGREGARSLSDARRVATAAPARRVTARVAWRPAAPPPPRTVVKVGNDPKVAQAHVTEHGDEDPLVTVQRCARNGAWAHVAIDPTAPAGGDVATFNPGCGHDH